MTCSCLCIGPIGSGKTLLLKRLQGIEIDEATSTVETVGSNIIQMPKTLTTTDGQPGTTNASTAGKTDKDFVGIREIGGSMSPLWPSYYGPYKPIIYVIDASNLFQISISTVHLMEILSHEKLVRSRVLIVLSKKELTNAKKMNLLKFMMRLDTIVTQVGKRVTVMEVSAMTGDGVEEIRKWIVENAAFSSRLCLIEKGTPSTPM